MDVLNNIGICGASYRIFNKILQFEQTAYLMQSCIYALLAFAFRICGCHLYQSRIDLIIRVIREYRNSEFAAPNDLELFEEYCYSNSHSCESKSGDNISSRTMRRRGFIE